LGKSVKDYIQVLNVLYSNVAEVHTGLYTDVEQKKVEKEPGLWIRIRNRIRIRIGSGFSDFVDPDPYWESGSRIRIQGQEN
jgi:hypothetical protein